jgi:hypothetical protein
MIPTERDLADLRSAVRKREVMHPFTIMRFQTLGWVKPNPKANPFFGGPIAYQVTEAGMKALRAVVV